jgi:AcrR family transcriptional regulator
MNQPDTRTRIQDVALRMFIDNGYEATSLREIAEEVGVTKAALYYHFKTKDEIVTSLIDDRIAALEELLAWGRTLPRTPETREAFVRRYAEVLRVVRHREMMQFLERNQTALREHPSSVLMKDTMISIIGLLTDREAPLTTQLKCALAIFAVHASKFVFRDDSVSEADREAAGLEVALELIS